MPPIATQRSLFDLPRDVAYLNAAYMGPMPTAAAQAGRASYDKRCRPWQYDSQVDFFDVPEAFRAHAAKLFGSRNGDVAIVSAVSYGLATAARALSPPPGSEIVVLAEQMPSNVYVWRELAAARGATVTTVTRPVGDTWTDALLEAIGPATSIVACPQVHWADGGELDLPAIATATRACGAALVLDLMQSLGVLPFDVLEVRPDFAVAACYKWLLGPYTLAALYVAPEHQGARPLEEGWIARAGSQDFARLVDYSDEYAAGARRFDMGERSAFQLIPAANVALAQMLDWGAENIAETLAAKSRQIATAVAPLGLHDTACARAPHYLCLSLPTGAPSDLVRRLSQRHVHVSQRGSQLRVTPHLYNDDADIERFVDALKAEL